MHVLNLLLRNLPKCALIGEGVGMDDLVFFECAFRAEIFPAIRAQKRSLHLVNWAHVSLNVYRLCKFLIAIAARMDHLLFIWQMDLFVYSQLLLTVETFGTLRAGKWSFVCLGVTLLRVVVKRLLVRIDLVTLSATLDGETWAFSRSKMPDVFNQPLFDEDPSFWR